MATLNISGTSSVYMTSSSDEYKKTYYKAYVGHKSH